MSRGERMKPLSFRWNAVLNGFLPVFVLNLLVAIMLSILASSYPWPIVFMSVAWVFTIPKLVEYGGPYVNE